MESLKGMETFQVQVEKSNMANESKIMSSDNW